MLTPLLCPPDPHTEHKAPAGRVPPWLLDVSTYSGFLFGPCRGSLCPPPRPPPRHLDLPSLWPHPFPFPPHLHPNPALAEGRVVHSGSAPPGGAPGGPAKKGRRKEEGMRETEGPNSKQPLVWSWQAPSGDFSLACFPPQQSTGTFPWPVQPLAPP